MEPDDEEVYEEGNVLTTTLNDAEISIASEFNYDAQKYGTAVTTQNAQFKPTPLEKTGNTAWAASTINLASTIEAN